MSRTGAGNQPPEPPVVSGATERMCRLNAEFAQVHRVDPYVTRDFWLRNVVSTIVLFVSSIMIGRVSVVLFGMPWLPAILGATVIFICLTYMQLWFFFERSRGEIDMGPIKRLRGFMLVVLLFVGLLSAVSSSDEDIRGEGIKKVQETVDAKRQSDEEYGKAVTERDNALAGRKEVADQRVELSRQLMSAKTEAAGWREKQRGEATNGGFIAENGRLVGSGVAKPGKLSKGFALKADASEAKVKALEGALGSLPDQAALDTRVGTAQGRVETLDKEFKTDAEAEWLGASGKLALFGARLQGDHALAAWISILGHTFFILIGEMVDLLMLSLNPGSLRETRFEAEVKRRVKMAAMLDIAKSVTRASQRSVELRVDRPTPAPTDHHQHHHRRLAASVEKHDEVTG